jgi:hypothetical protein
MSQKESAETLFSFSDAAPAPDDRRTGPRYTTLLRVGVIETASGKELCLIRNISGGGLMAHVYSDIAPGTRAEVELKSGQQVSGTVIWSKNRSVGLRFDSPIDVAGLLTACDSSRRPRMPRIEVDCFVSLRVGARIHRARTCDISQGGVKVQLDGQIAQGEVVVAMSGFRPIQGTVRWSDGELAGISFNEVIPLGELIPWLKEKEQSRLARRAAGAPGEEIAA